MNGDSHFNDYYISFLLVGLLATLFFFSLAHGPVGEITGLKFMLGVTVLLDYTQEYLWRK